MWILVVCWSSEWKKDFKLIEIPNSIKQGLLCLSLWKHNISNIHKISTLSGCSIAERDLFYQVTLAEYTSQFT